MRRTVLVVTGVLVLVLAGGIVGVSIGIGNAKDARDLSDLTSSSPWPRDELLVPDDVPDDGTLGWLDGTGLGVALDLTLPDGRAVPVVWQLHERFPNGSLVEGRDCAAVVVVTCTDIGDGVTLVAGTHAYNSPPGVAVYRFDLDRPVSVTVQGPDPVDAADLRPLLDRTHRPTDAELLELLRTDGYQTDWS